MILRVEQKQTKNYDNSNDEKHIEANLIKRHGLTFGEILTKIKLLKTKKTKRKIKIKRYTRIKDKFITLPVNITIRKTQKSDENVLIEDMHIYNEYADSEMLDNISFNSDEFRQWKEEHNNYFFPSLNAPWQVRRVFRTMEENLGSFEKERFLKLKFELWIYINKPMVLQEKVLDIMYNKRERPSYDEFVMGKIKSIIKNLNSINGYIKLIKYISEKRESMYMCEKDNLIQTDINILSSIEKQIKYYITDSIVNDQIKNLKIKPPYLLKKYIVNNFYN